jgi:CRISPR/Cas system-associated exonuclease Cas4 (RecB family)
VTSLNLLDVVELAESTKITYRGYEDKAFLTAPFNLRLAEKTIKSLSVSDISDYLCPTRRDLYFKKGKNKTCKKRLVRTWGMNAGNIVEDYFFYIFEKEIGTNTYPTYDSLKMIAETRNDEFERNYKDKLEALEKLKARDSESTEWFLNLLCQAGKVSLSSRSLDDKLSSGGAGDLIRETDLKRLRINPDVVQIGISKGVKPDFLLPSHRIVGDIKSGVIGFKDYFLHTCTGYALAYENAMGRGNDIDFGVISFFPTRCSDFAKPISFQQTYVFLIDDELRTQFMRRRNEAYEIISQDAPPEVPSDCEKCVLCTFKNSCIGVQ